MSWFKVDDKLHGHRKVEAAGLEAIGFWAVLGSYCADQLTDGFVTDVQLRRYAGDARRAARLTEKLVQAGLWRRVEGGIVFHQYLERNPCRAVVLAEREATKKRVETFRQGRKSNAVTTKGGNAVTKPSRNDVTDQPSNDVTGKVGNDVRNGVGNGLPDPDPLLHAASAHAPAPADPPAREWLSAEASAALATLAGHPSLASVATPRLAALIEGDRISNGKPLAWVLTAIGEAANKASTDDAIDEPLQRARLARFVRGCCARASEPEPVSSRPSRNGKAQSYHGGAVQPSSGANEGWEELAARGNAE